MNEPLCPIHNTPMKRVVVNQPTMAYVTRLECPECEHMKRVDARWNERRFSAAVAAMQGYIASNSMELYHDNHDDCMKDICESAVKYADALLEELAK